MIVELLLAGLAGLADEAPSAALGEARETQSSSQSPDETEVGRGGAAGPGNVVTGPGPKSVAPPPEKVGEPVDESPVPPGVPGTSPASEPGVSGNGQGKKKDDLQIRVVPVPIVNPTFGTGLAVAVLGTFGGTGRRSTAAAAGGYAKNGSWLVGAGGSLHFSKDKVRLGWAAGRGELKLKYFGTGADSILADNPIAFSGKGWAVQARSEVRLFESFYFGAAVRYLDARIVTKLPIDVLPKLEVPFRILSVGPIAEFDTRDSGGWPTSGAKIAGEYLLSRETAGVFRRDVVDRFHSFNVAGSAYFQIKDNLVLATQARAAGSSDDTPFFLKPSLSFRGFSTGEQLDGSALEAQAELRWMINRKLGVVAFSGIGATGRSLGSLGKPATGSGAGVRYRISQVDKTNVGFDVAHSSRGNWSLYFAVGEAF